MKDHTKEAQNVQYVTVKYGIYFLPKDFSVCSFFLFSACFTAIDFLLLKCFVYMCVGLAGCQERSWAVKARPSFVLSKKLTLPDALQCHGSHT